METIKNFREEYFFLSNFFPTSIQYEGILYPSVENAFQAAKSLDPAVRMEFSRITSSQAKSLGRKIELRPDWEQIKVTIMQDLLRIKFLNPMFRDLLISTENKYLVEENNWGDKFWGKSNGVGKNWLGFLLMEIRREYNR